MCAFCSFLVEHPGQLYMIWIGLWRALLNCGRAQPTPGNQKITSRLVSTSFFFFFFFFFFFYTSAAARATRTGKGRGASLPVYVVPRSTATRMSGLVLSPLTLIILNRHGRREGRGYAAVLPVGSSKGRSGNDSRSKNKKINVAKVQDQVTHHNDAQ